MTVSAGTAFVDVKPDFSNLNRGIEKFATGTKSKFQKIGKGAAIGMAAGGAVAGALLAKGFADSLDVGVANDKLAAQLGANKATSKRLGKIAGRLYADAYGDSLGEVNTALRSVLQNGLLPEDATTGQIKSVTASVIDLSKTFDQDLGGTTRAAGQLIRTGMAKDGRQALDILTRGFQQGGDKAEDLLDTFNEYGTQFRKLGLNGKEATGLITQGLKAGARDSDLVADSLKEFAIRAVDGSELTKKSFEALGLSAGDVSKQIAAGGPSAKKGLDTVLDKLRAVKDPAERAQIAVGLFGTQAEDLGDALFALDPTKAVDNLGKVEGAAKRMGDTFNDNAKSKIESFKRTALMGLTNFVGDKVIPALEDVGGEIGKIFDRKDIDLATKIDMSADVLKEKFAPIGRELGAAVSRAWPGVRDKVGTLARQAAGAFVQAWLASDWWVKLFTGLYLAKKLGIFRSIGGMAAGQFSARFQDYMKNSTRFESAGKYSGRMFAAGMTVALVAFAPQMVQEFIPALKKALKEHLPGFLKHVPEIGEWLAKNVQPVGLPSSEILLDPKANPKKRKPKRPRPRGGSRPPGGIGNAGMRPRGYAAFGDINVTVPGGGPPDPHVLANRLGDELRRRGGG